MEKEEFQGLYRELKEIGRFEYPHSGRGAMIVHLITTNGTKHQRASTSSLLRRWSDEDKLDALHGKNRKALLEQHLKELIAR